MVRTGEEVIMQEEAVIVSTARTPIGKAFRGALNMTQTPVMAAHAMRAAVDRAGVESSEIGDVVLGCALTQGTSSINVARHAVFAAGFPDSVPAATVDRQCASGLAAISIAANQIRAGETHIAVAGGVDSVSLVQNARWNDGNYRVATVRDGYYLSMLETADLLARRYKISRDAQDEYSLSSQQRTTQAQQDGRFLAETVSIRTVQRVTDRSTGEAREVEVTLDRDECNRPGTTAEALSGLAPVLGGDSSITAGNASQMSDGASASVLMSMSEANRRGIEPMGILRGIRTIGCAPEEMGIGPALAIPALLKDHGLEVDEIDLWEINEAFASQLVYCRDQLALPAERLNVNGGAISIGHPYGMSGARMVGHALIEGRRRHARFAVVSMCIGWGMGAAALLEIPG
jgi:acetyl-CoA acetyltransferases